MLIDWRNMYGYIGFFALAGLIVACLFLMKRFKQTKDQFFLNEGFNPISLEIFASRDLVIRFFPKMILEEPCFHLSRNDKDYYYLIIKSDSDETPVVYSVMIIKFKKIIWKNYYVLKNHIWNRTYLKNRKKDRQFLDQFGVEKEATIDSQEWIGLEGENEGLNIFSWKRNLISLNTKCIDGFIFYHDYLLIYGSNFRYKTFYRWTREFVQAIDST